MAGLMDFGLGLRGQEVGLIAGRSDRGNRSVYREPTDLRLVLEQVHRDGRVGDSGNRFFYSRHTPGTGHAMDCEQEVGLI